MEFLRSNPERLPSMSGEEIYLVFVAYSASEKEVTWPCALAEHNELAKGCLQSRGYSAER
jgi:hypothetical protein